MKRKKYSIKESKMTSRYTELQKRDIVLEARKKHGAFNNVAKKYKISPVTIYAWEKKFKTKRIIQSTSTSLKIDATNDVIQTNVKNKQEFCNTFLAALQALEGMIPGMVASLKSDLDRIEAFKKIMI